MEWGSAVSRLRNTVHMSVAFNEPVDGLHGSLSPKPHQSVVDILHISIVWYRELLLKNNPSCVDVFVEEERSNTRLFFSVDDSPVYRGRTAILRQQSRMDIECSETWHSPYHLRQHAKGYDDLKVSLITAELIQEVGILHLLRL